MYICMYVMSWIQFYFRYAGEDGNLDVLTEMSQELTLKLMKTFDVNADQAARLLMELKQCVKRKNLVRFQLKPFIYQKCKKSRE